MKYRGETFVKFDDAWNVQTVHHDVRRKKKEVQKQIWRIVYKDTVSFNSFATHMYLV